MWWTNLVSFQLQGIQAQFKGCSTNGKLLAHFCEKSRGWRWLQKWLHQGFSNYELENLSLSASGMFLLWWFHFQEGSLLMVVKWLPGALPNISPAWSP